MNRFLLIGIAAVLAAATPASAQDCRRFPEQCPRGPGPATVSDFPDFFLGDKHLFTVDAEPHGHGWADGAATVLGERAPRPVAGSPGRYLFQESWVDRRFIGNLQVIIGSFRATTYAASRPYGEGSVRPERVFRSKWLAHDLKQVIFFDEGDVWTARLDWERGALVDTVRVTNRGLFGGRVYYWYDNVFYFEGGFSDDAPVIRLDLDTGDLREIGRRGVFGTEGYNVTNPKGNLLIKVADSLYAYDAETDEAWSQPQRPPEFRGRTAYFGLRGIESPERRVVWLSDDVVVVVNTGTIPRRPLDLLARIDFAARTQVALHRDDGADQRLAAWDVLPGREHLDVAAVADRSDPDRPQPRYLMSLEDGALTPLALDSEAVGIWLSDQWFLFGRTTGGLETVGTWIYDRTADTSRRVCDVPPAFNIRHSPQSALLVDPLGTVYFRGMAGGKGYRFSVRDGSCEPVPALDGIERYQRLDPDPVDLGAGNATPTDPPPGGTSGLSLDAVYPNPSAGQVTLAYTADGGGAVRAAVYDALGRRVWAGPLGPAPPGRHEAALDLGGLGAGVYVVALSDAQRTVTRRVALVR